MRRRYDVNFDQQRRQYVVEMTDEQGAKRQVEWFGDWSAADHMRSQLNTRLEQSGELLAERRR